MTVVRLGIGLWLVGFAALSGFVVWYMIRTPPRARPPVRAAFSAVFGALFWPLIVLFALVRWLRFRRAARKVRSALKHARARGAL